MKEKVGFGIAEIIGDKRNQIIELANQHGAENVRVFGSVARGEADENSDVDFLVDWDYSRLTAWGSAGLFEELEALLERPVDIASENQLRESMKQRILDESIPL